MGATGRGGGGRARGSGWRGARARARGARGAPGGPSTGELSFHSRYAPLGPPKGRAAPGPFKDRTDKRRPGPPSGALGPLGPPALPRRTAGPQCSTDWTGATPGHPPRRPDRRAPFPDLRAAPARGPPVPLPGLLEREGVSPRKVRTGAGAAPSSPRDRPPSGTLHKLLRLRQTLRAPKDYPWPSSPRRRLLPAGLSREPGKGAAVGARGRGSNPRRPSPALVDEGRRAQRRQN